jgi:hypothetical protein
MTKSQLMIMIEMTPVRKNATEGQLSSTRRRWARTKRRGRTNQVGDESDDDADPVVQPIASVD